MDTTGLEARREFARRAGKFLYVTQDEHNELSDLLTPLPRAEVLLWKATPIAISDKMAERQTKEMVDESNS